MLVSPVLFKHASAVPKGPMSHDPSPRVPELLAPAGGPDALRAAVRNGADAVYLGTDALNARRGAENFTLETLPEVCRFAHLRGSRVYLTANVVVLESELEDALAMVARAWEAGVDAVIVQDLGLLRALRESLPDVRVHASTQIDAHNLATVRALADLGVSRVTLAREVSVAEIAALAAGSAVEVESFVHGSLCFCHSGQCLMSSMIGARSANRGLCAQPCRLPYDLVGRDGRIAEVDGRYLLSPKDLAGVALLPDLVRSGVAALKIEGRMKSPEYVAAVVSVYRAALDRAIADPDDFAVTPSETERLEEAFNRGFTEAYLIDERGDAMMSYRRPNNRGVAVARVAATAPGHATLALDRALESRDTIEFWTATGRFAQAAGRMEADGGAVTAAPARARVIIAVEQPVREGDRVFRVANASLLEAARRTYQGSVERSPLPVRFRVRLRVGEPAEVEAVLGDLRATATGAVVEAARTRPVLSADVIEHVGRLGGTVYVAADYALELDANAGLGFSALHALRREALEELDRQRCAPWARAALPGRPRPPVLPRRDVHPARVELVVAVSDPAAVAAVRDAGAERVLVAVTSADTPGAASGAGADLLLPRVAHDREVAALVDAARGSRRPVAGNLGVLAELGAAGAEVEADWGLNAVNPLSAAALAGLGASLIWASPEIDGRRLSSFVERSPVPVGVLAAGRLELMVAEHCILQAAGACSRECARCDRRRGGWTLRDRKGYEFPVTSDAAGRAHLYNSVPLDLSRSLRELIEAGVAAVRLDLHTEEPAEAARITRAWRERLEAARAGRPLPDGAIVEPATSGHFYRGLR